MLPWEGVQRTLGQQTGRFAVFAGRYGWTGNWDLTGRGSGPGHPPGRRAAAVCVLRPLRRLRPPALPSQAAQQPQHLLCLVPCLLVTHAGLIAGWLRQVAARQPPVEGHAAAVSGLPGRRGCSGRLRWLPPGWAGRSIRLCWLPAVWAGARAHRLRGRSGGGTAAPALTLMSCSRHHAQPVVLPPAAAAAAAARAAGWPAGGDGACGPLAGLEIMLIPGGNAGGRLLLGGRLGCAWQQCSPHTLQVC